MIFPGTERLIGSLTRITWRREEANPTRGKGRGQRRKYLKATSNAKVLNLGVRFVAGWQGPPPMLPQNSSHHHPIPITKGLQLFLPLTQGERGSQQACLSITAGHFSFMISSDLYSNSDVSPFCR